jgi:L-rhamnose 1-dehydrogenase
MLLEEKTVIVTGGSRGIGRAIAIGCAQHGAEVVVNYLTGPGEEVVDEIRAAGGRAVPVRGDVADPETGKMLVAAAVDEFGKVDVLVNNAGICPFHGFLDMPVDVMHRTNEVNYYGTFYSTQAAANRMVEQGTGGAIVSISSISALVGGGLQSHYTPTKAAMHSLMQSCAISLGPHGIRCNSVLVGTVRTDINREDLSDPEKVAYFERRIPLGRLGEPEDIVGPVVFLASDMAQYVTGAAFLADGGLYVNLQ